MSKYAIIKNNVVENTIEAEQAFIDAYYPDAVLLNENDVAGPGWTFENGKYVSPDMTLLPEDIPAEPTV